MKEDVPIGSSIGHVTARDDDSGENARISYSLDELNHVFSLNTSTGKRGFICVVFIPPSAFHGILILLFVCKC